MEEVRPEHLTPEIQKSAIRAKTHDRAVPTVGIEGLVIEAMRRWGAPRGTVRRAAGLLGVSRNATRYRLKKHGLA